MQLYVVFLTLVSQLFMLSIRNVEAQTDYIKMKTLRFIGMAAVAIIMSLNFAAKQLKKMNGTILMTLIILTMIVVNWLSRNWKIINIL